MVLAAILEMEISFQFSKNLFLKSYTATNFFKGIPKLNRNCGHCDTTIQGSCQIRFHEIFPNLSTLELNIKELIAFKQVQRSHKEEYSSQQNEYEYVWK